MILCKKLCLTLMVFIGILPHSMCSNKTPLEIAIERNDKAKVKLLIDAKADVNAKNGPGNIPYMVGGIPLFIMAILKNNVAIVKLFIDAKADVNAKDPWGNAPLHRAIGKNTAIVQLLIDAKADVNAKNGPGYTPLGIAIVKNNVATVKLLIDAKSDVNVKYEGKTLLQIAKNPKIKTLLKDAGAK